MINILFILIFMGTISGMDHADYVTIRTTHGVSPHWNHQGTLLAASTSKAVRLFDAQTLKEKSAIPRPEYGIPFQWTPDDRAVLLEIKDKQTKLLTINEIDIETQQKKIRAETDKFILNFSCNSQGIIAALLLGDSLRIYDPRENTSSIIKQFDSGYHKANLSWNSQEDELLLIGPDMKTLEIISLKTKSERTITPINELTQTSETKYWHASFNPKTNVIAAASSDKNTVFLIDEASKEHKRLPVDSQRPTSIAWSSNGQTLASASVWCGQVNAWDNSYQKVSKQLPLNKENVEGRGFSFIDCNPQGTQVAVSCGIRENIYIIDVENASKH